MDSGDTLCSAPNRHLAHGAATFVHTPSPPLCCAATVARARVLADSGTSKGPPMVDLSQVWTPDATPCTEQR
eukprot:9640192-Alexandrium_andersonii.AAC.1